MRKKLVSCILVVCMLLTMLPTMAWAEPVATDSNLTPVATPSDVSLNIANGSIVITDTGYTQAPATEETAYTGDYVITQTGTDPLANYIHVTGGTHNITLDNVKLNGTKTINGTEATALFGSDRATNMGPFMVYGNATVTLTLIGTNNLNTTVKSAALEVVSGSTVTIKVPDGQDNSYGKLVAENTTDKECAGIGGSRWRAAGTVIIESGTVIANSHTGGYVSGIGPGRCQDMTKIEIAGGVVTVSGTYAMGHENHNKKKVDTLEISGGTVTCSKGISADSYDITGGNIITTATLPPEDSNGRKPAKVYVVDANGVAQKNEPVSVTVNNNTWKTTYTDSDGIITTYLAESDTIADAQKLPDGWLIGATCTCAPTAFDWGGTVSTAAVFSTAMTIPVSVTVDKCNMPIHTVDDVAWTVSGNAEKIDNGKLTLKPAADDYTVTLTATLDGYPNLTNATHEITVTADSSIKSIDIGKGPVTVTTAAEEDMAFTYTQKTTGGDVAFSVSEDAKVVIFGEYEFNSGNAITITNCSPTIVLQDVAINAKKTNADSAILIDGTATDEVKLILSGENTLHREKTTASGHRIYNTCSIEIRNATLTIDCETHKGSNCDDNTCGDKLIVYHEGTQGAGIGARCECKLSQPQNTVQPAGFTLNIEGGYVDSTVATGYGAAIGTCNMKVEERTNSFAINIKDGYVKATASAEGVAIGMSGGNNVEGMSVAVTNGVVDAATTAQLNKTNDRGSIKAAALIVSGTADVTVQGDIKADSVTLEDNATLELQQKAGWTGEEGQSANSGGSITNGGTVDVKVSGNASLTTAGGINGDLTANNGATVQIKGNASAGNNAAPSDEVGGVSGTVTVGAGSEVAVTKEIKKEVTAEGGATINGAEMSEDVTIPAGKANEVAVDDDGTVALPAGSTVTKDDGTSVELTDGGALAADGAITADGAAAITKNDATTTLSDGGTLAADGTITAGGTVTITDAEGNVVSTVVVPEGKDATVSADGKVTAPAGTVVTDKDGKENTLITGGTVDKDGAVTETKPPYDGGYYPSNTPSETPAAPSVDSSSLNNAALAVGSAIKDGSAEFAPVNGYTKDEVVKLQKESKLEMSIEKKTEYSAADKKLIDNAITKAGGAVSDSVMYFDITVVLKHTDTGAKVAEVSDTEKAISITVDLNDALQKAAKDGKFLYAVRCHEGVTTFLETKLNAAKTAITFESSDFSTYAVVAMDKAVALSTTPADDVVTPEPEKPADKPAVDEPIVDEPVVDEPVVDEAPADDAESSGGNVGLWIGIGIVALAAIVAVLAIAAARKKRK